MDGRFRVDGRDVGNVRPGQLVGTSVVLTGTESWGEAVAAVIVLREGEQSSAEELRQWVIDHLRSSRAPERIEFASELPYNETG